MSREEIIVGVEIGTSKSCVVVGEVHPDGRLRILGTGEQPSRGVRKGEIVDADNAFRCVSDALIEAEERTDTQIRYVFLGITGSHIRGFEHRVSMSLDNPDVIQQEHLDILTQRAREESETNDRELIHALPMRYTLDGEQEVLTPVGLIARQVEADFHCISADRTRLANSINCLRKSGLDIEEVVAPSFAAAASATSVQERDMGVLVLDIGAGTTDFIAYIEGVPRLSGVLAVGGDHITNDISLGLRLPLQIAERLKIEEASLDPSTAMPGDTISIKGDASFSGRDVARQDLNLIVSMRVREIFELIRSRLESDRLLGFLGAGVVICGGCANLSGLLPFTAELFGTTARIGRPQIQGIPNTLNNPSLVVPIGITRAGADIILNLPQSGPIDLVKNFFGSIFHKKRPIS